jgi:type I restriction enzyme S subunit
MIPEGWKERLLPDICRPRQWPTIPKEKFTLEGYPVYGANGQIGHYSEYTHDTDTIAITCRGATCGTINWVPAYSYITGNAMALDNVDEANVSKKFLYFVLNHWGVADSISGSAQPQITGQSLSKFAFPFPPLPEQKRIAEVLDGVGAAIEATKAVIEQTKKAKQGLLQTLLTRGIGHTKFKDSPLGKIPEGWRLMKIADVCQLINGRAYKAPELLNAGKYPVLRVGNFFTNDSWYYSDLELPEDKYCNKGDLLYAWSASFGPRIWYGEKVIYHYHIWKVEPFQSEIEKSYLFYLFEWDVAQIKAAHGTGSTMIHVTKGAMENRPIALPSLTEQKVIVEILSGIDNQLTAETTKLASLQQLKKGLMHDLLTGKVRVA